MIAPPPPDGSNRDVLKKEEDDIKDEHYGAVDSGYHSPVSARMIFSFPDSMNLESCLSHKIFLTGNTRFLGYKI